MKPKEIMVIAGEPSGDTLAAELVEALRNELVAGNGAGTGDLQPLRTGLVPRFFGAGGPCMKNSGVEVVLDLTAHSVIGLTGPLKHYLKFRRFFNQLLQLALDRQPDAIVCVDFGAFNRRFAHAVRNHSVRHRSWFHNWQPKLIQYVSPQVWASRESRAYQIARDYDLLLTIFPFERDWYARRVPGFRVEHVGHPMVDRYSGLLSKQPEVAGAQLTTGKSASILLLPGSRGSELKRHLPILLRAGEIIRNSIPGLRVTMVLPTELLVSQAKGMVGPSNADICTGQLPEALARADLAIASTGTVTMECAFFRVPAITLYRTSLFNYMVARQLVKVRWLTMPNLLANEEIFPEFIQNAATPENIARSALELLQDQRRREQIKQRLDEVIASLGGPGANRRAAHAIAQLLNRSVGQDQTQRNRVD